MGSTRCVVLLWGIYQTEPRQSVNFIIAEKLLQNLYTIQNISSGQVAQMCCVSKTSLTRFCRDMGYEDFSDLRMDLYNWVRNRSDPKEMLLLPFLHGQKDIYEPYLGRVEEQIRQLRQHISAEQIRQIVQKIRQYDHVVVMGHMQSACNAIAFQQNLFCAGKMIDSYIRPAEQIGFFTAPDFGAQPQLILVFSVSGVFFSKYFPSDFQLHLPKGVELVMLTCNPDYRPEKFVTMTLNTGTGHYLEGANLSLDLLGNVICQQYFNEETY